MTENAIFHEPESKYCFATGKNTLKLRLRVARYDKIDKIEVIYGGKYEFAIKQLSKQMQVIAKDRLFSYYGVELHLCDLRLTYVFKITEKKNILYFSEDGLSDNYDFEFNYYNCFQYSYINEVDIHKSVEWTKSAVFYQIFIDRFCIGNKMKDCSYVNMNWGDIPTPKSFAGGDLDGITQKLDYLISLGINCIYLTPVFKSPSNHKYDIEDYYAVDERFGGKEGLITLVKKAHERGVKVVMDAVFNHCSENNALFYDLKKKGETSKYKDWFIVKTFSPLTYEKFASCDYMPKFNTSNEEVCKYLIEVAKYWTKELDLDGWRLDVSDEVSHNFWRLFRREIKEIKQECILIGENWHNANVYLRGDQFDGIMNYALTKSCLDFFAFDTFNSQAFADKLGELFMRNSDVVNDMMLNLIDSHDTHRFLTRVNANVKKLMSALAVIFFYPGMPCIYYGTENQMLGGYDPDSRRTFDWSMEKEETPVKELIRRLSLLKKQEDFNKSTFFVECKNDLVILQRKGKESSYRLIINGGQKEEDYFSREIITSHEFKDGKIRPFGFLIERIKNSVNRSI